MDVKALASSLQVTILRKGLIDVVSNGSLGTMAIDYYYNCCEYYRFISFHSIRLSETETMGEVDSGFISHLDQVLL